MSVKTSNFNQDVFDQKVASVIVNIHNKNNVGKKFNYWVDQNIEDLEILYEMSELECPEETFYSYVYDHSEIE